MVFDAYTSYPNQFLTIDQSGVYTKHYYSGAQRIASRVIDNNPNGFDVGTSAKMAASSTGFNFDALRQKQLKDLQMYLDKASGDQKKFTAKFAPYKTYAAIKAEEELAEEGSTDKKTTMSYGEKLYFFHPDHLGSSTYLTDANGDAYQFFLNLPFGETMAEGRNINEDFETPYKFNGKELDPETNMYYYGARYYDPKLSIWMSVDPLAEEFPNASPYNYCFNNPINLIDPDGRQARQSDDIIIRGKNAKTGEMEPAVIVKTDLVHVTVDVPEIPLIPTHDPITNKDNPIEPIVVEGVDDKITLLNATLGQADAITVGFGGCFVAGGGISGGGNVTAFLTGKDAGGVFLYSVDGPTGAVGLSVGGGAEVGPVYAASSTKSSFSRTTLTGYSLNIAGGYGPLGGTFSMGVAGRFDWTPTSYSFTVGTGFSSFKAGGSGSMPNSVLQRVIKAPTKR